MNIQVLGYLGIWRKHIKAHCVAMDTVSLKSVAGNSFNDSTFSETELKTGFNL